MKSTYDQVLKERVLFPLDRIFGQRLLSAYYWVLSSDNTNIEEPNKSGGCQSIRLVLDGGNLELSWGWEGTLVNEQVTYHIQATNQLSTLETSGNSVLLDATATMTWCNLIGHKLIDIEVLGYAGSPQAIIFKFGFKSIIMSIGYANDPLWIGNGDELLILSDFDAVPTEWTTLWTAVK